MPYTYGTLLLFSHFRSYSQILRLRGGGFDNIDEIQVAIHRSDIGVIMGPGGQRLRKLEKRYGVRMIIEPINTYHARVIIMSGCARTRMQMKAHIESQIHDDGTARSLKIKPAQRGILIGRHGLVIKEITSQFQVYMHISK